MKRNAISSTYPLARLAAKSNATNETTIFKKLSLNAPRNWVQKKAKKPGCLSVSLYLPSVISILRLLASSFFGKFKTQKTNSGPYRGDTAVAANSIYTNIITNNQPPDHR